MKHKLNRQQLKNLRQSLKNLQKLQPFAYVYVCLNRKKDEVVFCAYTGVPELDKETEENTMYSPQPFEEAVGFPFSWFVGIEGPINF